MDLIVDIHRLQEVILTAFLLASGSLPNTIGCNIASLFSASAKKSGAQRRWQISRYVYKKSTHAPIESSPSNTMKLSLSSITIILATITPAVLAQGLGDGQTCAQDSDCVSRLCTVPYVGPGGPQCIPRPAPRSARCDKALEATDCQTSVKHQTRC